MIPSLVRITTECTALEDLKQHKQNKIETFQNLEHYKKTNLRSDFRNVKAQRSTNDLELMQWKGGIINFNVLGSAKRIKQELEKEKFENKQFLTFRQH